MSLVVDSLGLDGFRGYRGLELSGLGRLTLLAGPNAVGKTNIVEGIELLTSAESFRRPAWGDTVSWGEDAARLEARLVDGKREVDHRLVIRGNERSYEVNGKKRSAAAVRGDCPCVLFIPDDLQLVKASSARRRAAADALGRRLSAAHARIAEEYRRTLAQRNLLLKEGVHEGPLFESWDESLATTGARLTVSRARLFGRLARRMEEAYSRIAPGERLSVAYVPSWERFDASGRQLGDAQAEGDVGGAVDLTVEEAAEEIRSLSARLRAAELARKSSLAGPHRDEMAFFVGGRNARLFASQGQQRTVVLAWKLAEVEVTRDISGKRPVLLLDDVMSELDERRRGAFAGFLETAAQTFVTTTNLGYFDEGVLARADVVELPIPGTRPADGEGPR